MDRLTVPSDYAHTVITGAVRCVRCGYDLRGLRADATCPECGTAVWRGVVAALDPDAARLPTLASPRLVGDGIFWLVLCIGLTGVLSLAAPLAEQIDLIVGQAGLLSRWVPPWFAQASVATAGAGLWAIVLLKPGRGSRRSGVVWPDLLVLGIGLTCWALLVALDGAGRLRMAELHRQLLLCAFAALVFVSLRGILGVIGQRSRRWRTSRARQGAGAMLYALAGVVVGLMLQRVLRGDGRILGAAMVTVCVTMLVIGLGYLVVNGWWIRRALRQPPPTLDEVLAPPLPADATVLDDEDDDGEDEEQARAPGPDAR